MLHIIGENDADIEVTKVKATAYISGVPLST